MTISDSDLTEAVSRVVDPELGRDLHTMGMLAAHPCREQRTRTSGLANRRLASQGSLIGTH